LRTGLQPVAWPSSPGVERASGESRTHTGRITGAVRCQLRHAGYHYLRQESNLVLDFRRVACVRHTPKTLSQTPGANATRLAMFSTTHHFLSTPAGSRTQTSTFGGSRDVRFTTRAVSRS